MASGALSSWTHVKRRISFRNHVDVLGSFGAIFWFVSQLVLDLPVFSHSWKFELT
jgi:hypothetical protein